VVVGYIDVEGADDGSLPPVITRDEFALALAPHSKV